MLDETSNHRIKEDPNLTDFLTYAYLFLHFQPSYAFNEDNGTLSGEDKTSALISGTAAEMIQSCVRKAAHIDGNNLFKVPAAMPMLFLLELMQKLRSIPSHILIDTATHNVILDFIFHFDVNELATGTGRQHQMSRLNSNRFTQSKEYLPSICEICEEFLNSEVDRIEIALKVLSCQWEICDSLLNSAAANPPQLPELYDRMPDMIYPLLLHPKQPEQLP